MPLWQRFLRVLFFCLIIAHDLSQKKALKNFHFAFSSPAPIKYFAFFSTKHTFRIGFLKEYFLHKFGKPKL